MNFNEFLNKKNPKIRDFFTNFKTVRVVTVVTKSSVV